ncbi:hypothetical protein GCM10028773_51610 [Spirosoma koreense]
MAPGAVEERSDPYWLFYHGQKKRGQPGCATIVRPMRPWARNKVPMWSAVAGLSVRTQPEIKGKQGLLYDDLPANALYVVVLIFMAVG